MCGREAGGPYCMGSQLARGEGKFSTASTLPLFLQDSVSYHSKVCPNNRQRSPPEALHMAKARQGCSFQPIRNPSSCWVTQVRRCHCVKIPHLFNIDPCSWLQGYLRWIMSQQIVNMMMGEQRKSSRNHQWQKAVVNEFFSCFIRLHCYLLIFCFCRLKCFRRLG